MIGQSPNTLRIAVAGAPQMLRKVLAGIVRNENDMELVEETGDVRDLFQLPSRLQLDAAIVIAGAEDARRIGEGLLHRFPAMKVALIFDGGRNGEFYELRPRVTVLRELSPNELVDAIRSSVRDSLGLGLSARDERRG